MVALHSLLDNDFYKFTMQQCVVKLFSRARARYQFINRGQHQFPNGFAAALRQSVHAMADLQLSFAEKEWLAAACPYLDPVYLDFLQGYRYNPDEVVIEQEGSNLMVTIQGFWYRTILWEVPVLSLISEIYYVMQQQQRQTDAVVVQKTLQKISAFNSLNISIAEFGTRRRHSYQVQKLVVETLKDQCKGFVGTSNVHLAMHTKTKPIGTHAHEWFMYHAAKYGFKMANTLALEHWVDVYRGELGIALSDTYTSAEFFEIFDKKFAKLFDGVRQDSGDPLAFADATINCYRKFGIDPLSKTIIFSDSLNTKKVEEIAAYCAGRIGISFGIGTNLTNDVGLLPMNIVLKMVAAMPEGQPWVPVVKLSDEKGKYSGDPQTIALAKLVLKIDEA